MRSEKPPTRRHFAGAGQVGRIVKLSTGGRVFLRRNGVRRWGPMESLEIANIAINLDSAHVVRMPVDAIPDLMIALGEILLSPPQTGEQIDWLALERP